MQQSIIEKIKSSQTLESYIEQRTEQQFKAIGLWKNLPECCFCGGHECARLSQDDKYFCFQCQTFIGDLIQFRKQYDKLSSYRASISKFAEDLKIKKFEKSEVDYYSMRQDYCEIAQDILFTCQTIYQWRGLKINPLNYLLEYRKHSYEAITHFKIGFNDGTLIERINALYDKDLVKASGLTLVPEGSFTYPFVVNGQISYFRNKDPNKLKKQQMPKNVRIQDSVWYNQDIIKNGVDLVTVEGEDDVVSLWDIGVNAAGSVGTLTKEQIDYLKTFELITLYSCFDADFEGKRDTERLAKNFSNCDIFVMKFPPDKIDIDETIRDEENGKEIFEGLQIKADRPSPEMQSLIREKPDGYYISKFVHDKEMEIKLTNWIGKVEAIIIQNEELRVRKVKIKHGQLENTVFMDGTVLSNSGKLKEFLLNNCNETCLFQGNDNDLNSLVQFWGVAYKPKIVREVECVGEIDEGFIADNIFVANTGEIVPLKDGYLTLNEKDSIKIPALTTQAGVRSEIPYFPLTESVGGIENFKEDIFKLLIKNRNLKMAIAIGWLKSCLWSKMFFEKNKFFPILMIHGKKESGKSIMCGWLMNMIGLEGVKAISLREGGTTGVGIERRLAYYSSLPVWADDYRNREGEGQKFHGFFRNIFDRSSASKGIKNDALKIRQVAVRGCLIVDGETATNDSGLNSRLVTFEITQQERNDKYYEDILRLEPELAKIGFNWVKNRIPLFPEFMAKYKEIAAKFKQEIASPRQAQVWAVAVAGALTEPYFESQKDKICGFAIKLANYEIEQQKQEEIIGLLWEGLDILHKSGKLDEQVAFHRTADRDFKEIHQLEIHLPMLLGKINGESVTRKYELPSSREVAKILKQEPYCLGWDTTRVKGTVAGRWLFDLNNELTPEILKNVFEVEKTKKEDDGQDLGDL